MKSAPTSSLFKPRKFGITETCADHPDALYHSVDLHQMIERIVLPPKSDETLYLQIRNILDSNELSNVPLEYSSGDKLPEYIELELKNRQAIIDQGIDVPIHTDESNSEE